jgi:hypothetical protein
MSEHQADTDKPQKRQQHGLTPAKKALKKHGTGALDQRTTEAKELARWKDALVEDLGGPDQISTQQETLIELAARQIVLLHLIDNWVFAAPDQRVFRKRDKTVYALTKERQRIADGLARYMAQLGMDRKARKGRDLTTWIAELEDENCDDSAS